MQLGFGKNFFKQLNKLKNAADMGAVTGCIQKFQQNPANPGVSLERIDGAKDPDIWSARANQDIRIILHKSSDAWLMLYVDHHDAAYRWAETVKIERHPETGNLQVVHVEEVWREVVREQIVEPEQPLLFADHADDYLLSLGVPREALPTLREVQDPDDLIGFIGLLPEAVWERLVRLAQGEPVKAPEPVPGLLRPIDGADAQRDFILIENDEDLERVLNSSWEEWVTFLHPTQKDIAQGSFSGPSRITGTAGTGKTVVAMHRARHLAQRGRRVLLTTYTNTLAANLKHNLDRLCSPLELQRITVDTVHGTALGLLKNARKSYKALNADEIKAFLQKFAALTRCPASADFLLTEWQRIIVPQAIMEWDDYRVAPRLGRGTALQAAQRKQLWTVFQRLREHLEEQKLADWSDLCRLAREAVESGEVKSPFDAIVVDEVQDLGTQEILLLKALAATGPDGLTVTGDAGQRIYPGGFSLSALGIETRGRSSVLRVNYRTSEDIRRYADRVLGETSDDLDGGHVLRGGVISLFRGPSPELQRFNNAGDQAAGVAKEIAELLEAGFDPGAIGVFARTQKELEPLEEALTRAGIRSVRLRNNMPLTDMSLVRLGTMHRAKGLEFQVIFAVSVNENLLPLAKALAAEEAEDRRQARERERQLLYVSITRAREQAHICYYGRPSPFLAEAGLLEDD
jgi:hypothetical protein